MFDALDTKQFIITEWDHKDDGGGKMSKLSGTVIEKGGVNTSSVAGKFTEGLIGKVPGTENNPSYILRSLEIGAHGILVPQIENKREANLAVNSIYYSPMGNRGVSAFTRASNYNAMGVKGRNIKVNDKILSILLVETAEAIANIEEIIEIDGTLTGNGKDTSLSDEPFTISGFCDNKIISFGLFVNHTFRYFAN